MHTTMKTLIAVAGLLFVAVAFAAEPPTTLTVKIPTYRIVKYGELSQIEMAGGQLLVTEEGRPEVLYYVQTQDYPQGYRIQAVTLKGRSGEEKEEGIRLPKVLLDDIQTGSVPMKPGRYPTKDFDWQVVEQPGGGSMLVLAVYPFVYDPGTEELDITGSFDFDVSYVKTTVTVTGLELDKAVYDPGETVRALLRLENKGPAQPVAVKAEVREAYGEGSVASLPERKLDLAGTDSVAQEWTTGRAQVGDCIWTVTVRDAAGNEIGRAESAFRVGNPGAEVTSFDASPKQLKLGSPVRFTLRVKNTGSSELAGQAVVEVRTPDSLIQTIARDFSGLTPGGSREFDLTWDTKEARKSVQYEALGFAAYLGATTLPLSVSLSTNAAPVAEFSFSPDTAQVDSAVGFDASASKDTDGEIAEYQWDFGDGGTETGATASHVYTAAGDYTVFLTVTDNEGGFAAVEKTVSVTE